MYDFLIVGAGITGLTLAERLSNDGLKILVIDKRKTIGGNCFDYYDENGIYIHKYGPHIFHTKEETVIAYIQKFTKLTGYKHKVTGFYKGKYYPIPINRETINLFYGINLSTEKEVMDFLDKKKIKITEIKNSKDVVVSRFGEELYEAFVKHYTKKQWDMYPEELDKSVLERLPVRYTANPLYFDDPYQGMPEAGYSGLFNKMISHTNITIMLETDFCSPQNDIKYNNLIFTGRIDEFFNYKFGKLDYRCINFEFETINKETFQPNAVVNYTDNDVLFTRITEFKKFYNTESRKTVICREYTTWEGEASYPVPNEKNHIKFKQYWQEAETLENVFFAGRLGTYKYINMDKAVSEALQLYEKIKTK